MVGKRKHGEGSRAASDTEGPWWTKFRGGLRRLLESKRGCFHCKRGTCYVPFQDTSMQEHLRTWHQQWALMSADTQDAHLLWIFHGDPTGGEVEIRLGDSPSKSSRVDEDRVPTDSAESSSPRGHDLVHTESEHLSEERIPTASSDSSDCSSKVNLVSSSDEPQKRKPRRKYNRGQTRRPHMAIHFMGHMVCCVTARVLMRVGAPRLTRVLDGRQDGRRDRPRLPGKMTTSVWRFLWRLYHNVAEAMPDKFDFASEDAQTMIVAVAGSRSKQITLQQVRPEHNDPEEQEDGRDDDEARAMAGHAMLMEGQRNPTEAGLVGPGMFTGPLRFLPPSKRIHLYWEYTVWAAASNMPVASLYIFLKAFRQCHNCLRSRKIGQHAVCHACTIFKNMLSKARFPQDRQSILEEYTAHILKQWMDRQVYGNATTVSLECRRLLDSGQSFSNLAVSVSQVCLVVDGMDQAKFRVPRIFRKSKGLEKLLRPALHVQGAWAHGFSYHLAVMDADMRHDTNNNVEVICRVLGQIFETHGGLPLGLHLQQDNTCRECKNQKILKWAIKLVALGVFQWVSLNYLITGHTHEDLDGTFGQLTVKLSALEFDSDQDVVALLMNLVGNLGIERVSRRHTFAYKMDEAASWEKWWDDITATYTQLTGPLAPHLFKVCLRKDLGKLGDHEETTTPADVLPGNLQPSGGDVVVVVKEHMHCRTVHQVFTAWPASRCGANLHVQPQAGSLHPRRPMAFSDRQKIASKAEELHATSTISGKARDYLVHWAMGTLGRLPRPTSYRFLGHRTGGTAGHSLLPGRPQRSATHQVRVRRLVAENAAIAQPDVEPADAGSDDDALGNNPLALLPG